MKKLFYHLAFMLLLSAGLTACSNDYDDPPEQPGTHQDETPTDEGGAGTSNNDNTDEHGDESGLSDYEKSILTTMTNEEKIKTGFMSMPLKDCWDMETILQHQFIRLDKGITYTFDGKGKLKVENLLNVKDYLVSVGDHTYDDSNISSQKLLIDNQEFGASILGNILTIWDVKDSYNNISCSFHRQRTSQNEIPYFFAEELNTPGVNSKGQRVGGGFYDALTTDPNGEWEKFYVINSQKELQGIYNGNTAMPTIDFSRYTLLIGFTSHFHADNISEPIGVHVRDAGEEYVLDVPVTHYASPYSQILDTKAYYWRLFPKFQKAISINIIITEIALSTLSH